MLFRAGTSLLEVGQPATAAGHFEQLRREAVARLGPDHPDTLTTRGNLAYCQGAAGDIAGSAAAFEELLTDRLRVLGPDHTDTLGVRANLAHFRGQAGNAAGAAAALEELLTDCLRVLGPDHTDTLGFRANPRPLAGAGWGRRRRCRRLRGVADRLPAHARSRPHQHPQHPRQPRPLGGQDRDAAGAAAAYEELLTDCLRVLGPDHINTLSTCGNIAHFRGQAGDAAGAAASLEELLTDHLRVLGPDHPHTLTTKNYFARWRGEAGDAAAPTSDNAALLEPDCHDPTSDNTSPPEILRRAGSRAVPLPTHLEGVQAEYAATLQRAPGR